MKLKCIIALILFLFSQNVYAGKLSEHPIDTKTSVVVELSNKQRELDEIYSLLAMSVVYKDWKNIRGDRGHNIGSVLVDPAGHVAFWARNASYATKNSSQHGEIRLISNYLSCNPNSAIDNREVEYLNVPRIGSYEGALPCKGFTLYSTLEPCAMCTGMMILTQLWRAVYIQRDPGYGDTLQRLSIDTSSQPNGYKPFPRIFDMTQLSSKYAKQLDRAYEKTSRQSKIGITNWLRSNDAKEIFRNAYADFKQYKSKFGNDEALIEAIKYLQNDVDDAYQANMLEECPTL